MRLTGLHHLTAITANAWENRRFYTETLGLRLVKKTVNQDDTRAYHLFCADGQATPGADLTFFDWPAPRERRGTRAITRTGLRVASEATLDWWRARLATAGVTASDIADRDGRAGFDLEDPEGQRLRLVVDAGAAAAPRERSPAPVEHQILGLGPVTISVPELSPTDAVLTRALAMERVRDYSGADGKCAVHVYAMAPGGAAAELHVAVEPHLPEARQGAGGVHHVAFRTPDATGLTAWTRRLNELRVPNSGEVERHYFRSLYFREPAGILFEITTDGPGFTIDEPLDRLGERLSLPPFLEERRASIEAALAPLD